MKNLIAIAILSILLSSCVSSKEAAISALDSPALTEQKDRGNTLPLSAWDNGVIEYTFEGLTPYQESIVSDAILYIENATDSRVIFESISRADFERRQGYGVLLITTGTSNRATIGYQEHPYMTLCTWRFEKALHELTHVLGLYHEHQRVDRDDYVNIIWENIKAGKEKNFKIRCGQLIDVRSFVYDYDSIMCYNSDSFGIGGADTILKADGSKIVRSAEYTDTDVAKILAIYSN